MCVESVYARGSAHSHVNATGPQRPVEPAGPHPLCHPDYGHHLGKRCILPGCSLTESDAGSFAYVDFIFWTIIKPSVSVLVCSQMYRGVHRRHCYPPSWRRWVFYLIPGMLCAIIGVCLYTFAETEENYYYTHSLWHVLVASCVVFLLPPKEKDREMFGWSWNWNWSWSWNWNWNWRPRVYTLCQSGKDELYTVT